MSTSILWFRRDLRLSDNPALVDAVHSADDVVGVFCLDDHLLGPAGAPRRAFLFRCLRALDDVMGGRLVVRHGDPVEVIPALAVEVDAASVHFAADFGPYGTARDDAVAAALSEAGIEVARTGSPYAVEPGSIFTKAGTPYRVFTPFSRAWRDHGWPEPVAKPAGVAWRPAPTDGVPDDPDLGDVELARAGEDAAHNRLDHFLRAKVDDYDDARDDPAADATSRVSADLKWGVLHPRQILSRLGRSAGARTFATELCWREFYADVLFHAPDSARQSMDDTGRLDAVGPRRRRRPTVRRLGDGPDRVSHRRRRHATAAGRGLDAQPGPHDRGQLPGQRPPPRLAARGAVVHAPPRRR